MHTQGGEVRQSPQGITAVISMDSMLFGSPEHCFDVVLPAWVSQIQPNLTHHFTSASHPPSTWAKHSPGQHSTLNLPADPKQGLFCWKWSIWEVERQEGIVGKGHSLLAGWSDFIHSPSTMDTSSMAMSPSIPGPRIPSKMSWEKEEQRVVN